MTAFVQFYIFVTIIILAMIFNGTNKPQNEFLLLKVFLHIY